LKCRIYSDLRVLSKLNSMSGRLVLAISTALAAVAAAFPSSTAAAWIATPAAPAPGQTIRLSNETTLTLSAYTQQVAAIHANPAPTSRRIGRLRWRTEDGFAELYLVLRAYTDPNGVEWVQLRIPGRPNGRTGWVKRTAVGPFRATRMLLVVNRRHLTITLYRNGKRVWRRPVGIGKAASPTPAGHFWIRERMKVHDRSSPYWPYALGTADYSTLSEWPGGGVVGIHGDWDHPELIPGRPSHGCIRMRDRDIGWLAPRVDIGTPLRVL
jgi:lipoprotein-anchoring transpeptidase ErfK/SrfK